MQSGLERHSNISNSQLDEFCRPEAGLQPESSFNALHIRGVFSELLNDLSSTVHFDQLRLSVLNQASGLPGVFFQFTEENTPPRLVVTRDFASVPEQLEPMEVSDIENENGWPEFALVVAREGFRSFRATPLVTSRGHAGTLTALRMLPGNFSTDDVQALERGARSFALIVETALMADVLKRETARLQTLLEVSTTLISRLNVSGLSRQIARLFWRLAQKEYICLALYDSVEVSMNLHTAIFSHENSPEFSLSTAAVTDCAAGLAFQKGNPLRFTHAQLSALGTSHSIGLLNRGIHSLLSIPLVSHGRKLGALEVGSSREAISEDDAVLLTQIGAQVAMAVDNARAHEEIAQFKERLAKEKLYLEEEISAEHNFGEVVGNSPALRQVLKEVEIAAPSDANVLLLGETGTGKELIARAVHRLSSRREENFIKVNCAAIPTGLLESELFGHEKGAFTGAISQKIGRIELADEGTLFLDEIGEIPTELQPKLLRVLQDHEFERLGAVKTIRVNVRVVAATNRDLGQAVAANEFRSDLYYRLNVFPIRLPSLRERTGDIPLLISYFVQKFAKRMGKHVEYIPMDLVREFEAWHWPGNIRELENFIERSVILTRGPVFFAPMAELRISSPDRSGGVGTTLEQVEREYILRTLREAGGIISGAKGAAARLGMKRTTLQSRIQKLGINRHEYQS